MPPSYSLSSALWFDRWTISVACVMPEINILLYISVSYTTIPTLTIKMRMEPASSIKCSEVISRMMHNFHGSIIVTWLIIGQRTMGKACHPISISILNQHLTSYIFTLGFEMFLLKFFFWRCWAIEMFLDTFAISWLCSGCSSWPHLLPQHDHLL